MFAPLWLSVKIAIITTVLVFIIGTFIAWLLARKSFFGKTFFDIFINLPLVLPPSVVGYYLLLILGNNGIGKWGIQIIFTWKAAVIAAFIAAIPLYVRTVKSGLEFINQDVEEAARLDASNWEVLRYITLPLALKSVLAGLILAFTRALGEFGATLMVAGNIPNKTQTMPLAIYEEVTAGNVVEANIMVLIMTVTSFLFLLLVHQWTKHHL